jgi:hypothetical protein
LIVPDKIQFIRVRIFNDGSFTVDVKSIIIPPRVQHIAEDAFFFCPDLLMRSAAPKTPK